MKDIMMMIIDDLLEEECFIHQHWGIVLLFQMQTAAKRIEIRQRDIYDMLSDMNVRIDSQDWPHFLGSLANTLRDCRAEESLLN